MEVESGKMADWLRVLFVLSEGPGSEDHIMAHLHLKLQF